VRREEGIALIEMLILGSAVVLMALPILIAAARLADATNDVHATAVDAASWVARHGVLPNTTDGDVDLAIAIDEGEVHVVAETDVTLFGVASADVSVHVTRSAIVPVSPYRSGVP
jgi:hypothetical protein